ncbi:hypothetical protein G9P44_003283 [Scheffersomyces stipitis]|nr:hypothetical protein G9P44_003283 [Scheffersomyces stipitis]
MTTSTEVTLGVLALQGAFREHIEYFQKVIESHPQEYSKFTFTFIEVKTEDQLRRCDSLVIPGGESTSISLIAERTNLLQPLMDYVKSEKPIWGTCAGLIFLSKQLKNGRVGQKLLGGLNVEVTRNAFGRQLDSFESPLDFSSFIPDCHAFPTVFIRAPVITELLHDGPTESKSESDSIFYSQNNYNNKAPIEVLHSLKNHGKIDHELIVAVRQGHILGTSFHPELATDDYRFHKWYIDEFVVKSKNKSTDI